MPNDPASPQDSDMQKRMKEKQGQWNAITAKRTEMLKAEKDRQLKRESDEAERMKSEQAAFAEEQVAMKERSGDREEWRQEQHQKRIDDEKKRKKLEEEKKLQELEQKKHEAERAERTAAMRKLHEQTVAHKVRDKRESLELEEQKEIQYAEHSAEKHGHELDEELKNTLSHLENERKHKINQVRLEAERQHLHMEQAAKQSPHSSILVQRQLLALDEEAAKKISDIEDETKHLKDEAKKRIADKKLIVMRDEERKKREATQRKEGFEKWLKEG